MWWLRKKTILYEFCISVYFITNTPYEPITLRYQIQITAFILPLLCESLLHDYLDPKPNHKLLMITEGRCPFVQDDLVCIS